MSGERAAKAEQLLRCEECDRELRIGATRCVYCGRTSDRSEEDLRWWVPHVERPHDAWVGIAPGQHGPRAVDDAARVLLLPSHVVDQRLRRPTTWFHRFPTPSRADAVHQLLEKSSLRSARFGGEHFEGLPSLRVPVVVSALEDAISFADDGGPAEERAFEDALFVVFGTLNVRRVVERSPSSVFPSSPRTRRVEGARRTVLDIYFPDRVVRVLERFCDVGGLGLGAHQHSLSLGVLKSRFEERGVPSDAKSHRFDVSASPVDQTPTGMPRKQRVERDALGHDRVVENVTHDWDLWSACCFLMHAGLSE